MFDGTIHSRTRSLTPEQLRGRGWVMPGHIKKLRHRNLYSLRLYSGEGKTRDFYYATRQEAQAAQAQLATHILAHSSGLGLAGSPGERLAPYVRDWLVRRRGRLAQKTSERYESMAGRIARDPIGVIRLSRLTARALEAFYGRLEAGGLSSTTACHFHRLLHKALQDAMRGELIRQNPAALAEGPRRKRIRPEVWSEAQVRLFLSEAREHSPYYGLYLFLTVTGARLGEAIALRWDDVSLSEGTVLIRSSLIRPVGGGYVIKGTKTYASERSIGLPHEMIALLAVTPHRSAFVFSQSKGPLHANNIRYRDFKPLCVRLGLPWKRGLHGLRHFHASFLLEQGVNVRSVSERLGHQVPSFTLNTYIHAIRQRDVAVSAIEGFLSGDRTLAVPLTRQAHDAQRRDD